jgi:hypothetical protein
MLKIRDFLVQFAWKRQVAGIEVLLPFDVLERDIAIHE